MAPRRARGHPEPRGHRRHVRCSFFVAHELTGTPRLLARRKSFVPIHPPNILSHLPPEAHLGPVDPATLPADALEATEEELRIAQARAEMPGPAAALNLQDVEVRPKAFV